MFKDRIEAGQKLVQKLDQELNDNEKKNLVVLSIPRGGVIIGSQIAKKFFCLYDVIVTKKLRAPGQDELAIGAVGETSGSLYVNQRLVKEINVGKDYLDREVLDRQKEIKRREAVYRRGKKALDLRDKVVVIVDDGAATGATVIAAAREVWSKEPKKVIIALPVVAQDTLVKLGKEADGVIVLDAPSVFYAVGQFYEDFPQVEDEEVIEILSASCHPDLPTGGEGSSEA